jgi:hypothetical protein
MGGKGDLFFYMSQSGAFDENNALLKQGRIRIQLTPNPFAGTNFKQELLLKDGHIKITAGNAGLNTTVLIWVDVFNPVIHVDVSSNKPVTTTAIYESWRHRDRINKGKSNNANSYKFAAPADLVTYKDEINFKSDGISFYHRNKPTPSVLISPCSNRD